MEKRLEVLNNLAKFITSSPNLQHLDISSMSISDDILFLADAFRLSKNLISIHIGDNNLSQTTLKKLFVHMGLDYNNVGSLISSQSNASTLYSEVGIGSNFEETR